MLRSGRFYVIASLVTAVSIALGACGGGDSTSGDSSGGGVPAATAEIAKQALSAEGTFVEPSGDPVKTEPGKKLMVVSCGQAISACQYTTDAAIEAATELNWKTTLYDTKADPTNASVAIQNAIAQDYDGIFMYFIDCSYAKSALSKAKAAGIPVVAAEGYDCSELDSSAPSLFTYTVEYAEGSLRDHAYAWGQAIAAQAIDKLDGSSHALAFADDTAFGNQPLLDGMKEQYDKCDGCSFEVVTFPFSAFGTSLQRIAEQQLVKNPDVDTVLTTYEAISLEVEPAVAASGRDIYTFVGEGGEPGVELIRKGVYGFGNGWPLDWEGWAVVDAFARIFAGDQPASSGIGNQTFDADHYTPDSGRYVPPIDFRAAYRKLWGIG